jgi:hypothetical protein
LEKKYDVVGRRPRYTSYKHHISRTLKSSLYVSLKTKFAVTFSFSKKICNFFFLNSRKKWNSGGGMNGGGVSWWKRLVAAFFIGNIV